MLEPRKRKDMEPLFPVNIRYPGELMVVFYSRRKTSNFFSALPDDILQHLIAFVRATYIFRVPDRDFLLLPFFEDSKTLRPLRKTSAALRGNAFWIALNFRPQEYVHVAAKLGGYRHFFTDKERSSAVLLSYHFTDRTPLNEFLYRLHLSATYRWELFDQIEIEHYQTMREYFITADESFGDSSALYPLHTVIRIKRKTDDIESKKMSFLRYYRVLVTEYHSQRTKKKC